MADGFVTPPIACIVSLGHTGTTGGTDAELQRRALATEIAARRKEAEKRNERRSSTYMDNN